MRREVGFKGVQEESRTAYGGPKRVSGGQCLCTLRQKNSPRKRSVVVTLNLRYREKYK